MDTKDIIKQIDKWLEDVENNTDLALKSNRNKSLHYYSGMSQALWNIKSFIEVNEKAH